MKNDNNRLVGWLASWLVTSNLANKLTSCLLVLSLFLNNVVFVPEVLAAPPSIINQSDLQFAGAFILPDHCGAFVNGLTVRYVDGVRHILTRPGYGCGQYENDLFDYVDPGPAGYRTTPPFNLAVQPSWGGFWGKVGVAKALVNQGDCHQCHGIGLYWDEQDQRLYSNFTDLYASDTEDPSVTQSRLDDATHTGTDIGCFGFQGQSKHATSHGVAALPPSFVSKYLPAGERLAAGFGGPWESVNSARYSHGPALTSFVPPTQLNGCPTNSINWVDHHLGLFFPYQSWSTIWPDGEPKPARMLGFGHLRDEYGGWNAVDGHGWFLHSDGVICLPVWTDAVEGLFCLLGKSDGKLDATVLANPTPTMNSARISTVYLEDGSTLQPGDGLEIQIGPLGGENCNGTSVDILLDTVDTATGDITWKLASYGPVASKPPLVGGFVKGSAGHYCHAYPGPMRVWDLFQVYNLDDIGKVIQGKLATNDPNPVSEWVPVFPNTTHTNPRGGSNGAGVGGSSYSPFGIAYDPIAHQLLVGKHNIDSVLPGHSNSGIYVFNVRTSAGFQPAPPTAPFIVSQPQNAGVPPGTNATFSIGIFGDTPLTYQWQIRSPGSNSFAAIPGAPAASYTFSNAQLSNSGTQFRCVVSNAIGTITSNAATLTVGVSFPPPGQPGGLPTPTLKIGRYLPVNGTLIADYLAGYSNVSFQWTITPAATNVSGAPVRSSGRAASANFSTSGPSAGLGSYALSTGDYSVTVQAVSGGQSSGVAQATVTLVPADFSRVRVFPNPWRKDRHATKSITFDGLPMGSTIKLFTVSGHHVRSLMPADADISWDLKNSKGDDVASGIYLYVISAGDQSTKGKVVVIK